jgi:hypothetical protein
MPAATVQQRATSTQAGAKAGVISRRSDRAGLYPRGYPQAFPTANFPVGVRIGPVRRHLGREGDDLP